MMIYFISSSSVPSSITKPGQFLSGSDFSKWKGRKDANDVNTPARVIPEGGTSHEKEKVLKEKEKPPTTTARPTHHAPLFPDPAPPPPEGKMNATFVTLARNSDLWDIVESIRQVEDRFNRRYHYDWVFLNDKEFDEDFKKVTTALISGKTRYGIVPKEHWSFPEWIDQEKAREVREDMHERKIIYGDSISYRHMCRFESGFFYRHPMMLEYEWYWRVEPNVKVFCDVGFDPFRFMAENKKIYSFVISLYEYVETIPTIWDSVKKFIKRHPEHLAKDGAMDFLSDDDGDTYNHCHWVGTNRVALDEPPS